MNSTCSVYIMEDCDLSSSSADAPVQVPAKIAGLSWGHSYLSCTETRENTRHH